MAKKKQSQPTTLSTYTARAEDLKIVGYVEGANEKDALKKARKLYGATSVELRATAPPNATPVEPEPHGEAAMNGKSHKPARKAVAESPTSATPEPLTSTAKKK